MAAARMMENLSSEESLPESGEADIKTHIVCTTSAA
jgi:hypothetical protein